MGKKKRKKSFREELRERGKQKPIPPMPPLDDPIYDELEPKQLLQKDRPLNAPEFFIFLVDGHNCIHKLMEKTDLSWQDAHQDFLQQIINYRHTMWKYYKLNTDFHIYLDNYQSRLASEELEEGIKVFHSTTRDKRDAADIEIVEIVRLAVHPEELIVASSDRYCRQVEDYGAKLFKAGDFLQLLRTQLPPDYIGDYRFV